MVVCLVDIGGIVDYHCWHFAAFLCIAGDIVCINVVMNIIYHRYTGIYMSIVLVKSTGKHFDSFYFLVNTGCDMF